MSCVWNYRRGEVPPVLQLGHNELPTPILECTRHMCPIQVHWHVKQSYREYWRVKMTIRNLNLVRNYSQWNLVVLHPNLRSITQVFSFDYKPLDQYGDISKLYPIHFFHNTNSAGVGYMNLLNRFFFSFFFWVQTTQGCFMGLSITMTCCYKQEGVGLCKVSCYCIKMQGFSHLMKDGCFQERFHSMVMSVFCLHLINIQCFQILVNFWLLQYLSSLFSPFV